MRLALVTPAFHPQTGGAETYTRYLSAALSGMGHEVRVITSTRPGLEPAYEVDGVSVTRVGPTPGRSLWGTLRWFPPWQRACLGELNAYLPDVVLAQYSGIAPARRFAERSQTPLVTIVHDLYGLAENLRWRGPAAGLARYWGNDRLLRRVHPDAVVAVSEATATATKSVLDAPVLVARPGSDHVPEGPDPRPDSKRVLFVGRAVASKGVDDVVRVLGRIRELIPEIVLTVVSSGIRPNLPDWVECVGHLDDDALDRTIRSSAVLVLPSRREGWGLVVTEAAARKVPYVAYDIPALHEQHMLLRGGLLVSPHDPVGLERAIKQLIENPALRRRLGRVGYEIAREQLTWEKTALSVTEAIRIGGDRRAAKSSSTGVAG